MCNELKKSSGAALYTHSDVVLLKCNKIKNLFCYSERNNNVIIRVVVPATPNLLPPAFGNFFSIFVCFFFFFVFSRSPMIVMESFVFLSIILPAVQQNSRGAFCLSDGNANYFNRTRRNGADVIRNDGYRNTRVSNGFSKFVVFFFSERL